MDLTPAPFRNDLAEGPAGAAAFWVHADDGVRLRVAHYPSVGTSRGTILLFPGRTEYVEKYGRTAVDFSRAGYDILTIDWRGQGLADRLLGDANVGHVTYFIDYQRDVAAMITAAGALNLPRRMHLIAHSMGGCIGLRAVMDGLPVASCVFTGPMWGIRIAPPIRPAAWALGWGCGRIGLGHVYAPGTKPTSYVTSEPFKGNLLTSDAEMYAYMRGQLAANPQLALGGPSMRWLHQALQECRVLNRRPSPDLPCLTLVGTNERIVDVPRIHDRMARWPQGTLEIVEGGEHEVLMEGPAIRARVMPKILALLETAPNKSHKAQSA
ncbi:alpha/beta fold hydrolase [Puniceibacterium sediminis]|uniref:Lysophospholipase n=1 Tax=Puniceibacterium sediminis TaxID=1608407 RepID=A0A238XAS1_9RHOB|nr:alpha/beta hydrolase [Puniceibacterium sediminis]SNR55820.1 lysophospholipase [Puniceibacterium sediminis]